MAGGSLNTEQAAPCLYRDVNMMTMMTICQSNTNCQAKIQLLAQTLTTVVQMFLNLLFILSKVRFNQAVSIAFNIYQWLYVVTLILITSSFQRMQLEQLSQNEISCNKESLSCRFNKNFNRKIFSPQ